MLEIIECKKKVIVTNGVKTEWYNNIDLLRNFDNIDIRRHSIDDYENQKNIKSDNLLSLEDFKNMDNDLKEKIRINITCFKYE